MPFLYENMQALRDFGNIKSLPNYIVDNLNHKFDLRPYQIQAFENYITWFESDKRPYPIQNLFHMATGSGKTLIMAGLILYLYRKGYRKFLFFVNLSNIIIKTKENFLEHASSKYLFNDEIIIDGEHVVIKEVENFQDCDDSSINICFKTTQGLHTDTHFTKENSISLDDFKNQEIVLISDEAHHLNVATKKRNKEEETNYNNWETTVKNILYANKHNILLEFTATCELNNPEVKAEYEDKIIFNYDLARFTRDKYSKDIKTLRCDISLIDRALQAIVLSQYRLKIFQDNKISAKPVVLFKSKTIAESKKNMKLVENAVSQLTGEKLEELSALTDDETMKKVWQYFKDNNISLDMLAQEIREDFSKEHFISANDENEATDRQISLNSLEDSNNPYRAVFEVQKLDEGWDVLNLFDIVRMYETRDGKSGKPGKSTVSEAQLIGRGARYFPFKVSDEQDKFKRKYDEDIESPLRICEELYYHCQNDSRYIGELKNALHEIGMDIDKKTVTYVLKDSFKKSSLYLDGYVFTNAREEDNRKEVLENLFSERNAVYTFSMESGSSAEDSIFGDSLGLNEHQTAVYTSRKTISEIAEINYSIVNKALCKYSVFKFNILKSYFPSLKSTREFVFDKNYLGNIRIDITSPFEKPNNEILYRACTKVLGLVSNKIKSIEKSYVGKEEFEAKYIHDVFKNSTRCISNSHDGCDGISQNDSSVPQAYKLDLMKEDWFAFEDNFGTSEEKAFVSYFKAYADDLKKKYDTVFLVRNERHFCIYSFDEGKRFEPDYVLFLSSNNKDGYDQLQIFIEPKGSHLIANDKWKEDFLLQLKERAIPVKTFVDDNKYKIWGFHFFNREYGVSEFREDMENLL